MLNYFYDSVLSAFSIDSTSYQYFTSFVLYFFWLFFCSTQPSCLFDRERRKAAASVGAEVGGRIIFVSVTVKLSIVWQGNTNKGLCKFFTLRYIMFDKCSSYVEPAEVVELPPAEFYGIFF